jgi:hypothetical protein
VGGWMDVKAIQRTAHSKKNLTPEYLKSDQNILNQIKTHHVKTYLIKSKRIKSNEIFKELTYSPRFDMISVHILALKIPG